MSKEDFNDVFTYYFERRLGKEGSAGELARAVNKLFDLDESEGLKRQSINNWRRGSLPREWWQIAAITCILCDTQQEADTLLQAASHNLIDVKRAALAQQVVTDEITRKRVEVQVVAYWDEKSEAERSEVATATDAVSGLVPPDTPDISDTETAAEGSSVESVSASPPLSTRRNKMAMAVAAVLLMGVLVGGLGYFFWPQQATTEPSSTIIVDDFSDLSRCRSQWNLAESAYAECDAQAGVLRFDMPAGSEDGWMDDVVDSTLTGDFLFSRIKFIAAIHRVSNSASSGGIGIQTDCNGDGTWMIAQIGGPDLALYAEYGEDGVDTPDGMMQLGDITIGREHEVELRWLPSSIQVSLDGVTYEETIPCSNTKWLQIIVSGEPETHIQGHISQIEAWTK